MFHDVPVHVYAVLQYYTRYSDVKHKWNNSYLNCGWVRNRSSNMNYFIYTSCHFTPHGRYELNKFISLPRCGFIAQLVVHRTGITEVPGSNPFEALIFSGVFFPIAQIGNLLRWSFFTFTRYSFAIFFVSYTLSYTTIEQNEVQHKMRVKINHNVYTTFLNLHS